MALSNEDPNRATFNRHALSYSEEIEQSFGPLANSHDFFVRHKAETVVRILDEEWPGQRQNVRLLDVGCGIGLVHQYLVDEVGAIDGVDVSDDSLGEARRRNLGISYYLGGIPTLPFADATYDCAIVVCVLHHVPVSERTGFMSEVSRILRPGGILIVIEHNPMNPATRWVVGRNDLDRDAVLLMPRETEKLLAQAHIVDVKTRQVLFTPFKSRVFRMLDDWLRWIPMGAQYVTYGKTAVA